MPNAGKVDLCFSGKKRLEKWRAGVLSVNQAPDLYHPSPYEQKMDEEEQQYRRQRGAQEREQERARERDPRYEWMR